MCRIFQTLHAKHTNPLFLHSKFTVSVRDRMDQVKSNFYYQLGRKAKARELLIMSICVQGTTAAPV